MTATEAPEAPAQPKQRKRTRYEDAGVGDLRQPDGTPFLGETGRFRPGYDAKLKSQLIEQVLDPEKASKVQRHPVGELTAQEAEALLGTLNWITFLDASRTARANRKTRKAATATAKAESGEASADRLETAKKNKADAQGLVDQAVKVTISGRERLGKVLRVHRSVEDDILSPWVAVVGVPDKPRDADSSITEHEVPVSEVTLAT